MAISIEQAAYLKEILEQPHLFQQLVCHWKGLLSQSKTTIQSNIQTPSPHLPSHEELLIGLGEGSSYNALMLAKPFIERALQRPFLVYNPHQFWYKTEWLKQRQAFITVVSQSGKTDSVREALNHCNSTLHRHQLITCAPEGTDQLISSSSGLNPVHIHIIPEVSIPATKSMTSSLLTIIYSVLCQHGTQSMVNSFLTDCEQTITNVDQLLSDLASHQPFKHLSEKLTQTTALFFCGDGPLDSALDELSLKISEVTGIPCRGFNYESFRHGPKAMLYPYPQAGHSNPTLLGFLSPSGPSDLPLIKQLPWLQKDIVAYISFYPTYTPGITDLDKRIDLLTPDNELSQVICTLITGQYLSYQLALHLKISPNHQALKKTVTRSMVNTAEN